jgi:hypothetical protein
MTMNARILLPAILAFGCSADPETDAQPSSCIKADRYICCDTVALQDELAPAQCFATEADRAAFHALYLDSVNRRECRVQHTDDECDTR